MSLAVDELRHGGHDAEAVVGFLRDHEFPLVEGNHVTFAFVGKADELTLQHFIYGLETSVPFERLGDTDLWLLTLELPPNSRVEYKFGLRRGEHVRWIRDPLNPRLAHDPFGANSVCQTDGYVEPDWAQSHDDVLRGEIVPISIDSERLGGPRAVSVYLPARFRESRRYPLLIVHDGHDFLRFASLQTVLDNLIERLEIAPMIVALTTSPNRLDEYGANRAHADHIVEELMPTLEQRFPLRRGSQHRGLMGASFGGVASLSTAWYHPGVFGRLLLLSGSFAFTDIGPSRRGPAFDPVVDWMGEFREKPGKMTDQAFVACGVYESLIYENRSIVPLLQAAGVEVKYQEVRDGHNWENWRDRLRDGLSWLFPGPLWLVYE